VGGRTSGEGSVFGVSVVGGAEDPVIVVRGEIDLVTVEQVRACVDGLGTDGRSLVFDLSGTTFMDSSGVNFLVALYRRQGGHDKAIVLIAPQPSVLRTLGLAGLDEIFTIVPGPGPGRGCPAAAGC
jgi:anti-sigma B factor antagonist